MHLRSSSKTTGLNVSLSERKRVGFQPLLVFLVACTIGNQAHS
jgi:hypothetical protein